MKKAQKIPEITRELICQMQNLQTLVDELSDMVDETDQGTKGHDVDYLEKLLAEPPSNIIPFPVDRVLAEKSVPVNRQAKNERRIIDMTLPSGCLLATPGEALPAGLTDYRPLLQRDGLILLSWDKRITEMGERYTAYWVTSIGIPRYYASKALPQDDFPSARPDHKSYAAEDGIEFYGQDAPLYVVHVAPELMLNSPQNGNLRTAHAQLLKEQGSTVDYDYKYLLKTEKEKKREKC